MSKILFAVIAVLILTGASFAQSKKRARPTPTPPSEAATPAAPKVEKSETPAAPVKKNERANAQKTVNQTLSKSASNGESADEKLAPLDYVYEFSQPKFVVSRIIIEHGADGKGRISIQKNDVKESFTDPLEISAAALDRLKVLWEALNFLDSTEDYQSAVRDYGHLGTMTLRRSSGGKQREAVFNWTENQTVKDLTDEYKKLTEQSVWIFEMNIARENLPLNSPQLIDRLDSLVNRNQLSDPRQMIVYLRGVADDERIPLLARNHTLKIIQRIEKQGK